MSCSARARKPLTQEELEHLSDGAPLLWIYEGSIDRGTGGKSLAWHWVAEVTYRYSYGKPLFFDSPIAHCVQINRIIKQEGFPCSIGRVVAHPNELFRR